MEKEKENLSKARIEELVSDCPKSGLVEVRLKNPKRTGTITVRDYTDVRGQRRPYVDQYGSERVLRVKRTLYLDLSKQDDRLTYEQVRNHPVYVGGARPVLYVINHETEADKFVALKDLEAKAMEIIQKLTGDTLKDFARILLVRVKEGSSDTVIKRSLYEKAVNDPSTILNEWNDENRDVKSIIRKGVESGMFVYKFGKYTYNTQLMGTSFEQAVQWLKDNEDLVPSLLKELNPKKKVEK